MAEKGRALSQRGNIRCVRPTEVALLRIPELRQGEAGEAAKAAKLVNIEGERLEEEEAGRSSAVRRLFSVIYQLHLITRWLWDAGLAAERWRRRLERRYEHCESG